MNYKLPPQIDFLGFRFLAVSRAEDIKIREALGLKPSNEIMRQAHATIDDQSVIIYRLKSTVYCCCDLTGGNTWYVDGHRVTVQVGRYAVDHWYDAPKPKQAVYRRKRGAYGKNYR